MSYRIFIVEDDRVIAESVKRQLDSWGWQGVIAEDFSDVVGEFVRCDPQLVLLDISLPFYNGYHWCSEIRRLSKAPIIFISSTSDKMNIVMAMNMGGDDFIAKPFDLTVLSAKVQAMLRRTYDFAGASNLVECEGAVFNTADGSLSYNGQRLELTRNEHRIMRLLLENRGRTVSRDAIMLALWESDSYVDENTLSVNITRLRRKLAGIGLQGLIKTRKGEGYGI